MWPLLGRWSYFTFGLLIFTVHVPQIYTLATKTDRQTDRLTERMLNAAWCWNKESSLLLCCRKSVLVYLSDLCLWRCWRLVLSPTTLHTQRSSFLESGNLLHNHLELLNKISYNSLLIWHCIWHFVTCKIFNSHVEINFSICLWLLPVVKDSEIRGKPLPLGRTYHRRRTLGKTKTAAKATGNHPGKVTNTWYYIWPLNMTC